MLLEEPVTEQYLREEVDRIVRSEGFRNSEVLRRLLLYLCDKAVSGEADHLKEYTVATEGLGKPPSYDPQHSSTARIQIGRLRQRLAEYYRTEGLQDSFVIDLPKGRFRLTCTPRFAEEVPHAPAPVIREPIADTAVVERPGIAYRTLFAGIAAGALFTIVACLLLYRFVWIPAHGDSELSPSIRELWGPIITSKKPIILSIEDPLFLELHSNPGIYYRDRSINTWTDVLNSESIHKLTQNLSASGIQPSRYYTSFGEAEAAFHLGTLLNTSEQPVAIMRTSQLSWHQLSDNNIVFVGVQNLFFEQLQGMPVANELIAGVDGIQNTHPANGEPSFYKDEFVTAPSEQGTVYALVTRVSGPMGSNDVISFTSIRSPGYVGAVESFSTPESASHIVKELKAKNNHQMPRSYQVLLRIRFKDNVPTTIEYVLSRVLK